MVIRAIVYAQSKDEAFKKATSIFEQLCENQNPFDYFTTFAEEGSRVSCKGMWGNIIPIAKADSPEGQELIEEGMKFTLQEANEALNSIRRNIVKFTNAELIEENQKDDMFRYRCYCVGKYWGSGIYLYDHNGQGIRNNGDLENALSKWACVYEKYSKPNPYEKDDIWVVPADVHC